VKSDIVVALLAPAELCVDSGKVGDGRYALRGVPCGTGFPPWPMAADLLVREATQELCGLAYQVSSQFRMEAAILAARMDPLCAAYIVGPSSGRPLAYKEQTSDVEYLQVLWGETPDTLVPAQLAGDVWYYRDDSGFESELERVEAIGVADLQELFQQYGLRPPNRLRAPITLRAEDL